MKKIVLMLFAFNLSLGLTAQDSNQESYYPLTKGMSKTLTWYSSKYREIIKDTVQLGGRTYTHIAQVFPPKKTIDIYLRKSNDTIYTYNDVKKSHVPFFGVNPKAGEIIGDGKVIEVGAKLRTPKGKLTDLLVIEMNYSNGTKDIRYFKRGLGLVAVKNKNKLICYYVPD